MRQRISIEAKQPPEEYAQRGSCVDLSWIFHSAASFPNAAHASSGQSSPKQTGFSSELLLPAWYKSTSYLEATYLLHSALLPQTDLPQAIACLVLKPYPAPLPQLVHHLTTTASPNPPRTTHPLSSQPHLVTNPLPQAVIFNLSPPKHS